MKFNHVDIHSHLQFPQFDEDRKLIIEGMQEQRIATITVGTDLETSQQALDLAIQYDNLWATVGHHPTDWHTYPGKDVYQCLLGDRTAKLVAIGECGLDYYRDQDHQEEQKKIFIEQIELALEFELPLMIHGRPTAGAMNAYEDIIDIVSNFEFKTSNPGNIHFFAGNTEIAKRFLELGFTLSFDGPITFARDYDEVIRYIPRDCIHAETDAPFAAPVPYRGQRNSPLYVGEVIKSLAEIRRENQESLQTQLLQNAQRVFGIS